MKIRVDDLDGPGAAIYVNLIGFADELNKAKDWCRERWPDSQVHPYVRNFSASPYPFTRTTPTTPRRTTIQFWHMADVILFKLTWA